MTISVGFIGLGNMGNPMALNVLKQGYALTVFDMNSKAMKNVVEAGAKGASSGAEVVENSEVVLTSLPGSPEVEAFYLSAGGAIEVAKAGTALVDLSSVLPSTPRKLEASAKARGLQFLEAPVSGGITGARAATLAIMTGGDAGGSGTREADTALDRDQYLPSRRGGFRQHAESHQQHDVDGECLQHDGRLGGGPEGGTRSQDDVRGGEGEQRQQRRARSSRPCAHSAQLRARLQGGADEQGPGYIPCDRERASRPGDLLEPGPALSAGGARRRLRRKRHERDFHADRAARRDWRVRKNKQYIPEEPMDTFAARAAAHC